MLFGTWSQARAYDPSDYMAQALVFNNQIITGLLLLSNMVVNTVRLAASQQNQQANIFLISNCMQL